MTRRHFFPALGTMAGCGIAGLFHLGLTGHPAAWALAAVLTWTLAALIAWAVEWEPGDTGGPGGAVTELTHIERTLLGLLGTSERRGLELVRDSDGEVNRGTVYVALMRMEDEGLVESRPWVGAPSKLRLYRVTDYGARVRAAFAGGRAT